MESGRAPATLNTACKFGVNCYRRDCFYRHPPGRTVRVPECRYGARCCMTGCSFAHPAPRDPLGSPQDPYACPSVRTTPAAIFCPPAAPVTPARSREEPELTGIVSADDAVFARIRAAEAAGQVIDVADDDVPPPKRVKTEVGVSVSPTTVVSPYPKYDYMHHNDDSLLGEHAFYNDVMIMSDSSLVKSAAAGDLADVVKIVEGTKPASAERAVLVNKARRWVEVYDNMRSPFNRDRYGDTALIAAARHGHADVVRFLLAEGLADPTLESMVEDDYCTQNAHAVCEFSRLKLEHEPSDRPDHYSLNQPIPEPILQIRNQLAKFDESLDLIEAASKCWLRNAHASAFHNGSFARSRSRAIGNRPTDVARLRESIANVPRASLETNAPPTPPQTLAPSVSVPSPPAAPIAPPSTPPPVRLGQAMMMCAVCSRQQSRIGCPNGACKTCCVHTHGGCSKHKMQQKKRKR